MSSKHPRPRLVGPSQAPIRVCVAVASHDHWEAQFGYSLANLGPYSIATIPNLVEYGVVMVTGTYVHSARQQALQGILRREEITHVLWLDADMKFPRDALARLLAHDEDVVGINYCMRGHPFDFVALKSVSWDPDGITKRLFTGHKSTGLEDVDGLGLGCCLMKTATLRRALPSLDDEPWFWFEWSKGRRQVGEDIWFCRLLQRAGVTICVDHDLSKECAHIGRWEYTCKEAEDILMIEARQEAAGD